MLGGGAVVNRGAEALYNWQASKSSVHERFSFMFNNELLADIHFKVRYLHGDLKNCNKLLIVPKIGKNRAELHHG